MAGADNDSVMGLNMEAVFPKNPVVMVLKQFDCRLRCQRQFRRIHFKGLRRFFYLLFITGCHAPGYNGNTRAFCFPDLWSEIQATRFADGR